jgi:hypothetical protein
MPRPWCASSSTTYASTAVPAHGLASFVTKLRQVRRVPPRAAQNDRLRGRLLTQPERGSAGTAIPDPSMVWIGVEPLP